MSLIALCDIISKCNFQSLSKSFCSLRSGFNRAIYDASATVYLFFFSVICIVNNCSWQLMFDEKAKKCWRTYLFSNWWLLIRPKSFLKSGIFFLFILNEWWRVYQSLTSYRIMPPTFISSWNALHQNYITPQKVLHL